MNFVNESKICPSCKKIFTKEETYKDRKYEKHLIERDWKKRRFCSNECNMKYYSSQFYRKFENKLEQGCIVCKYNDFPILELHHIDKDRKNNSTTNVVVLCPNCHKKVHKGFITPEELYRFCIKEGER